MRPGIDKLMVMVVVLVMRMDVQMRMDMLVIVRRSALAVRRSGAAATIRQQMAVGRHGTGRRRRSEAGGRRGDGGSGGRCGHGGRRGGGGRHRGRRRRPEALVRHANPAGAFARSVGRQFEDEFAVWRCGDGKRSGGLVLSEDICGRVHFIYYNSVILNQICPKNARVPFVFIRTNNKRLIHVHVDPRNVVIKI